MVDVPFGNPNITNPFARPTGGATTVRPSGGTMTFSTPYTQAKKNIIRLDADEFHIEVTDNLDGIEVCIQLLEKMKARYKEEKK